MCSDSAVIRSWIVRWTYGITVQEVDVAQWVDELAVLYTNIRLSHRRNTTTVGRIVLLYPLTDYNGGILRNCSQLLSFRNILGMVRALPTIEEVRAAEKKVQKALDALKESDAQDQNSISTELKNATDEYARAVRELNSK
jgi:hypothetical protein